MVPCYSINAGSVVGIPRGDGTLKSYLMQKNLNLLQSKVTGMEKLLMQVVAPLLALSHLKKLLLFFGLGYEGSGYGVDGCSDIDECSSRYGIYSCKVHSEHKGLIKYFMKYFSLLPPA